MPQAQTGQYIVRKHHETFIGYTPSESRNVHALVDASVFLVVVIIIVTLVVIVSLVTLEPSLELPKKCQV